MMFSLTDGANAPKSSRTLLCALLIATSLVFLGITGTARADFGVSAFEGSITNQDRSTATQAGSHPFALTTTIQFSQTTDSNGNLQPDGNAKDIQVALPPGLVGDPSATPQCSRAEVLDPGASVFSGGLCPASTQVGTASITLSNGITVYLPLYNLVPPPGTPAQFAFVIPAAVVAPPVPVFIDANLRTGGDYGVTARVTNASQAAPLVGSSLTFWGVPGDASHDELRGSCLDLISGESDGICPAGGVSVKPLLTLPTSCAGPQTFGLSTDSWQSPGSFVSASFVTHDSSLAPVGFDGCERLDFNPSLSVRPSDQMAASPTGLQVDLRMPQENGSNGLAEAHLKTGSITLPPGVAVSPSAAAGLAACGPEEIGLKNADEPACPSASRIGTVEVETPLLPDPLTGSVFLAKQNDNPFATTLAMYLVIEGHGVLVKLAGRIDADPETGQLTATFDNLPQVPFSDLLVEFFGGPHAPLSNPTACGTYTTTAAFTSWSGKTVQRTSDFTISGDGHGGPCAPGQFRPSFSAGLQNPIAGSSSSFMLRVQRGDLEKELKTIATTLPPGLLAKIAGVPLCSDAAAATGNCPTASQVGEVQAGAGPGTSPFYIDSGKVFLTEGYDGAPFGLAITVPAVAGPFNLGVVSVRAAVRIDPVTAQVTVDADPMPRILDGIPLQVRDLRVIIDRHDFMQAPTSCAPSDVAATIGSYAGDTVALADRFQVGDCSSLSFGPKLKISQSGSTSRTGHPALKAVVTDPKTGADANIDRAQVNLPHGEFLDQSNLNKTCTKPVLLEGKCPASSVYGHARAWTPLLEKPLEGPVYLVGGYGYKLPALVAELNGQIKILLVGKIDTGANHGIRSTFEAVPDAPVSRFELSMKGGETYGLLENSENLCKASEASRQAIARFTGQNGKVESVKPVVANQCGKAGRGKRHSG